MSQFNYLMVLLFIAACAVFIVLAFRIRVKRFWSIFLATDIAVLIVYVAWDYWAIVRRNWYFDKDQILGWMIASRIPIEEILFFIVVPLTTVLTYLALKKLTGWGSES